MSYRNLEIYREAMSLFFRIHALSLKLPKCELYELGSQVRRSADSVVSNIVEGYGRNVYKAEFLKFLIYAHSSNDETISHIFKIKHLYPEHTVEIQCLEHEYNQLGAKINKFIQYVRTNWNDKK